MNQSELLFRPPRAVTFLCYAAVLLGLGSLVIAFRQNPERVWPDLLVVSYYLLCLGLAGLVFVSLFYVTGATWSVPLRRVPEAMAAVIPVSAIGLGLVFLASPSIYPWVRLSPGESSDVASLRQIWFQQSFFLARAAMYFAGWILLGFAMVRISRLQDKDGDHRHMRTNIRLSAAFLVIFGVTFWLASNDWLMSLEPKWSSTIFPVYQFAGLFLSGLAAIILLAGSLYWLGPFCQVLTQDRLHDLGTLLFGFSSFWMYIWFCQYLLIWYVNAPEETGYYERRMQGVWGPLLLLNVGLNWGVPFLVLLPRAAKRSVGVLAAVSLIVVAGRWLDLYIGVLPYFGDPTLSSALLEIGLMTGATGILALVFFGTLGRAPFIPIGDPLLTQSASSLLAGTEQSTDPGSKSLVRG
jgi:hypothetical protein